MKRTYVSVLLDVQLAKGASFSTNKLSLEDVHRSEQAFIVLRDVCYLFIKEADGLFCLLQLLFELNLIIESALHLVL